MSVLVYGQGEGEVARVLAYGQGEGELAPIPLRAVQSIPNYHQEKKLQKEDEFVHSSLKLLSFTHLQSSALRTG
jgi:hypothetical protein